MKSFFSLFAYGRENPSPKRPLQKGLCSTNTSRILSVYHCFTIKGKLKVANNSKMTANPVFLAPAAKAVSSWSIPDSPTNHDQ